MRLSNCVKKKRKLCSVKSSKAVASVLWYCSPNWASFSHRIQLLIIQIVNRFLGANLLGWNLLDTDRRVLVGRSGLDNDTLISKDCFAIPNDYASIIHTYSNILSTLAESECTRLCLFIGQFVNWCIRLKLKEKNTFMRVTYKCSKLVIDVMFQYSNYYWKRENPRLCRGTWKVLRFQK